ncbi:MAG: M23 family metallopeptidase, partial [Pseudomonadota bacterium]
YAHLHSYLVKHGDLVRAGQKVGTMGRTGRATGVHLHYEVIVDDRPVDPQRFFEVGRVLIARAS